MTAINTTDKRYANVILALQGGGALGAYQAGVYEGMIAAGYTPNWVTGVSIGSINAALIAGNHLPQRVERLREFWELVSSGLQVCAPDFLAPLRQVFNRTSAAISATLGVPGFYAPRFPPATLMPDGHPDSLSVYDTHLLRRTLERLIDFDLINHGPVRFSAGAVNIRSGNSTYFDSTRTTICLEHVMASCALPPAFPPVEIDGEQYWDGGVVSNTPLWYVLDDSPHLKGLIVQVDLFNASEALPQNLDQVMERHKDIMYSSKTRLNTTRVRELQLHRGALQRLLRKLPEQFRSDPDVKVLESITSRAQVDIVHLINRHRSYTTSSKDNEFSRANVQELWASGLEDARHTATHPEWLKKAELSEGVRVYDLAGKPDRKLKALA